MLLSLFSCWNVYFIFATLCIMQYSHCHSANTSLLLVGIWTNISSSGYISLSWQSCHTMSFVTVELHSELPFKATCIYVLFLSLLLFSHELLGYVTKHCHHCISQHPTLLLTHQMDLDFLAMQPLKWKEPCS